MDRTFGSLVQAAVGVILLAWASGMVACWAWAIGRLWSGRPLLGGRPNAFPRPAPWGFLSVVAVCLLYVLVGNSIRYLHEQGVGSPRAPVPVPAPGPGGAEEGPPAAGAEAPGPVPLNGPEAPAGEALAGMGLLVQLAVISILMVLLVPPLLRLTSGATWSDLGLVLEDPARQAGTGVVAALLATPVVLAIQALAVHIWLNHKHPVEEVLMAGLTPASAAVAVLSTMALAPLVEELLFRGVLQRWLIGVASVEGPVPEDEATIHPQVDRTGPPCPDPSAADRQGGPEAGPVARGDEGPCPPPALTIASPARPTPSASGSWQHVGLGIVLTSIAFASLHLPQWPAPIAIFVLSMALGVVYQRTGSLLTVVAMHGTFNGFSTFVMLYQSLVSRSP
ncbi:CAAX amino terminal protease self- immunity [Aquisphaera giovannonii]|uniref:CAAX amino terminal protease self-immunity n=1 Tax=Aquisphaera giovannonii TaxID=406548 RepID=A0A5B9W284_9BACT|nr:CPBP family intramembrane glutamic endopeptidase [Aquisphaera giovannonii]QEH34354.1 CAAX amino terminal protease self- immunity [Aquisphaera giovannonii]